MFKNIKKYFLVPPTVATLFFVATSAFAALPAGNAITIDDVSGIIGVMTRFLIATSMVFAVLFIVLSGIMFMVSQGDPGKFKEARARLNSAIWGVAVVLATGVIINTVASLVDRSFFCQISLLGICLY